MPHKLHGPKANYNKNTKQRLKILLANNLPTQASAFEEALNVNPNYVVRTTSDAREIDRLFAKWHFDILFLDMNMAHLPGSIVLAHFATAIKAKDLAVIAMCEPDDFAMVERALVLGALDACSINILPAEALGRAHAAARWLRKDSYLYDGAGNENKNVDDKINTNVDVIKTMPFSMLG